MHGFYCPSIQVARTELENETAYVAAVWFTHKLSERRDMKRVSTWFCDAFWPKRARVFIRQINASQEKVWASLSSVMWRMWLNMWEGFSYERDLKQMWLSLQSGLGWASTTWGGAVVRRSSTLWLWIRRRRTRETLVKQNITTLFGNVNTLFANWNPKTLTSYCDSQADSQVESCSVLYDGRM